MTSRRNRYRVYDVLAILSLILGIFLIYKGYNLYGILLIALALVIGLNFYMRTKKKVKKYHYISTLENCEKIIPGVVLLVVAYLGFTEDFINNFIAKYLSGLANYSQIIFGIIAVVGLFMMVMAFGVSLYIFNFYYQFGYTVSLLYLILATFIAGFASYFIVVIMMVGMLGWFGYGSSQTRSTTGYKE